MHTQPVELIAKTTSQAVVKHMGFMLTPLKLEYGTPLGAEAAVHSSRQLLANVTFLKLNFNNVHQER